MNFLEGGSSRYSVGIKPMKRAVTGSTTNGRSSEPNGGRRAHVWSVFLRVYLNLRSMKKSKFWIFSVGYEGCEGRNLD